LNDGRGRNRSINLPINMLGGGRYKRMNKIVISGSTVGLETRTTFIEVDLRKQSENWS